MSEVELTAQVRYTRGKVANRQLRRSNKIPAILYGTGLSVALEMDEDLTRRFFSQLTGAHQLVPLKVTDPKSGETAEHHVLVQEIQKHPYRGELLHVDFRKLDADKPVVLKVPLKVVGNSPGVKKGGVLQMVVREVPVSCLPTNIPEFIEVDVSNLDFHENIRVQEAKYPENVSPRARQNYSIASIIGRKKAETPAE